MAATMVAFARKYEIRFLVDRGLDVRMQIVLDFGFSHFYLSIIEPPPLNLSLSLSITLTHLLSPCFTHACFGSEVSFPARAEMKNHILDESFSKCVCVCVCLRMCG